MRFIQVHISVLALVIGAATAADPAKNAKAKGSDVEITVDCTDAPDLKEWGEKARTICIEQYPKLCEMLDSPGFTPSRSIKIVFNDKYKGVAAATSGDIITVSVEYVRKHKDDYGMVVHELAHVVQAYRRGNPGMGWMTEGIADYVRFYKYEPGADRSRINPTNASYKDSYRTTAAFLNFLAKRDPDVVKKLNAAMRAGGCDEKKVNEILGGDLATKWREFVVTLESKR